MRLPFIVLGLIAATAGIIAPSQVQAQTEVVTSCGGRSFVAGQTARPLSIDVLGNLCTNVPAVVLGAGSAIIGKVGIDQTTPGTTNAVSLAQVGATTVSTGNGTADAGTQRVAIVSNNTAFPVTASLPTTPTVAAGNGVVSAPSSEALAGITPVVSAALESNHVIKASAGNLYSAYVTTGATSGWFLVANSTTAPTAGGAAIAPIACVVAPANSTVSIGGTIPLRASTGITLVFSTSGCLTNTASTTAFFSGLAN